MALLTITAPRTDTDIKIGRTVWEWLREHSVSADYSYDGSHVRVSMPYGGRADLQYALDASTAWNIRALRARPLPNIYAAGVRYRREPICRTQGQAHICEEFLTAHETYARKFGDCDDLGPWLAGIRRLEGDANARAVAKPSAAGWHIVVLRGNGTVEDPSARLGMKTS